MDGATSKPSAFMTRAVLRAEESTSSSTQHRLSPFRSPSQCAHENHSTCVT